MPEKEQLQPDTKDAALLKEIRENFDYTVDAWESIRKEGAIDMRCVSGDAWDPEERTAREQSDRLCLSLDELNQYTNQLINDVRQNKRGIKVTPLGNGATPETAELRADKIREIERKSNAQAAYTCGFENAVQRSYGCWRIAKEFKDERSMDQEIRIRRIPNPDNVYFDPDSKERDCSDGTFAFVKDSMRIADFKREYPNASITQFSAEMWGGTATAGRWFNEKNIQRVEYWRIEKQKRKLLLLARGMTPDQIPTDGQLPQGSVERVFLDELEGAKLDGTAVVLPNGVYLGQVLKRANGDLATRESETKKVVQYITNGVEILEKIPWDGKYIPLVPCFGKEIWVDRGKGPERVLMSLVRLAREPYMLYCYYRTCEAEVVGMAPRTVWVMYEGQVEGHEEQWKDANVSPVPYLLVKPVVDAATGHVLPLPVRNTFEPPIQALELGSESARRAIQSAMGLNSLPTSALRHNEKSGKALEQIEAASSQGSFHFVDNYESSIAYTGRIIEDLLEKTIDTARDEAFIGEDDQRRVLPVNQPVPDPKNPGQTIMHRFDVGDHDVDISVGPSSRTQYERAQDVGQSLLANEMFAPRIAWLVIKLMELGPIGDQISELLTPPDIKAQQQQESGQGPDPAELQAQLQEVSQKLQMALQQLQGRAIEKQIDTNSKERIAALQAYVQIMVQAMKSGDAVAIAAAERQAQSLEAKFDRAHESAMAAQDAHHQAMAALGDREHQATQADLDRGQQTQQSAADRAAAAAAPAGT